MKSAFEQDIKSANVTVDLSIKAEGQETKLQLAGPYQSNGENKLPSVDWKLNLTGAGMPKPIAGQIISTGDDAFVVYGGETYQVGKENIAKLKLSGAGGGMESADVGKLLTQMQDWFPETSGTQDAELDGEPVTRISGKLDLSAALEGMKELAKQPGASGFEGIEELSNKDLKEVEKVISDPNFTIDVGKSDGKLRRIAANMTINADGEKGAVAFSVKLGDVDKPVDIQAPSGGRPIEELMQKFQEDFGGGGADPAAIPEDATVS
ncbi:hypothetical protein OJ997_07510 [Solirubrobacter phytolaccae]|uniref:Uncharacterized protein n=1 Tax=Solirubrobacter phytolaccae TaxID=1404360 RepID=A0A9X3SE69_9ACTN|nr:hypothetical protein [Solirubrobacter phytolaccae]MDA0180137.1 hypothetical protein [Solirubrobacter phytolaccae]